MQPSYSVTDDIRLYAQLAPNADSLQHLRAVQAALPRQSQGYAVTRSQLHLTLLHIGKVRSLYETIQPGLPAATFPYEVYWSELQQLISESEAILHQRSMHLEPIGFAGYGAKGGTLVIEYQSTDEIVTMHGMLLAVFIAFLQRCGIADPEGFMAADINLQYALQLKPHLTIYKGYKAELPHLPLSALVLNPTPYVYPPV